VPTSDARPRGRRRAHDKEPAREQITAALREHDWSGCSVSLRINGLDTHSCCRDIVDVVEQAGGSVDKVLSRRSPARATCTSSPRRRPRPRLPTGCHTGSGSACLIETAAGMYNVDEIAAACPERMEAMLFGVADYAASLQSHTTSIGGSAPRVHRAHR
jgi:malyl-CoA/(S)-citramalyl-CoA lyase